MDEASAVAADIHARKAVDPGEGAFRQLDHLGIYRAIRSLLCRDRNPPARGHTGQPVWPASLLHADGPERLVKATGARVLDQFLPGCPTLLLSFFFATLRARKFLCRYHGAIDSPEPAHDDQNMGHNILLTALFGGARFGSGKQSLAAPGAASMPQAGRIARPIQISRTAPMKPQTR